MSLCGRPDHEMLFCPYCYHVTGFNRLHQPLTETSPVSVLIIADSFVQAHGYAQRWNMADDQWLWVMSAETLKLRPDAKIVCVREELYREDLMAIAAAASALGKEIHYEPDAGPT